jgi:hypothetical protein
MSFRRALFFLPLFCFLTYLAAGLEPRIVGTLPSLRELSRQSAYIFAGTVIAVEHEPSNSGQLPVMRITFRVNQAIRGVADRQFLVLREWAGLWDSGDRYRVGQRLLLFLYRPSRLGLTSPVRGSLGRFVMNTNGEVVLQEARRAALFSDPALSDFDWRQIVHRTPEATSRVSGSEFAKAVRRVTEE